MGIILNFKQTNLIQMSTPEEQAIQGVIDQIWDTYDVDKSGALDKEETKKFVQDTLETSVLETSSPKRPSMRFSPPSTRTTPVPSRSQRWSPSSSNSSDNDERLVVHSTQ